VDFDTIGEDGKKKHHSESLKAKVRFVKPGEEQTKPDADLDKIVGLAEVVEAQVAAEEHAKRNDWNAAQTVMRSLSANLRGRSLENLGAVSDKLGDSYSSNVNYLGSMTYTSSVKSAFGGKGFGTYTGDAEAMKSINSVGLATSNATMDAMDASFSAPTAGAPVSVPAPSATVVVSPSAKQQIADLTKALATPKVDSLKSTKKLSKSKSKRW
jgi:hypothetical protein